MNRIAISVVDELLEELSPEAACGNDLEYDPQFLAFEIAAKGKPEVQYGDTITPATAPEWKIVLTLALELLARSRDLRLAVPMTRALLHLQGFSGMAIGLRLVEQLLVQRWETVHPQLDPDDDNDPTARINTLATLAEGTAVLKEIKDAALIDSRVQGRHCLRDIDLATGEQAVAEGVEKPSLALIDGAFTDIDLGELQELHQALTSCCDSVTGIETTLTEKVGAAQALNLTPLYKTIDRARRYVGEKLAARGVGSTPQDADDTAHDSASLAGDVQADGTTVVRVVRDEIGNREDVLRALDKICNYYSQYEPSSPVPLLLQRAQRLVDKNFIELLEDLAPEGLNQVCNISGISLQQ